MRNGKIIVLFSLLILVLTLSSFKTNTTKDEIPQWRNVQMLPKDLTHDQMDEVMDAWSTSLGVSCGYCHTKGNLAADDKEEKKVARKMLTMTNEINSSYFGKDSGTVSCMTCHNGKAHP